VQVIALGTNAVATAQMLKAGANKGASGENATCRRVLQADCIVGPIAITWANAMLGEVTPRIAVAVTPAPALKILISLSQEKVEKSSYSWGPLTWWNRKNRTASVWSAFSENRKSSGGGSKG
jgi:hypothetical protein